MANIQSDELGKAIAKVLEEYKDVTIDNMINAVDKVAKEAVSELKSTYPKRTGAYAKDWAAKKEPVSKNTAYSKVVYNKKHYRLTHLLEYGHKVKPVPRHAGKRSFVDANPHIATVEQKSIDELVKLIKEGV